MSKMIPRETIDVLRNYHNVSVNNYGISCDLYIPSNAPAVDELGIYATVADVTYVHYTALVYVEWSPNANRLRAKGLYTEGELPIIARFSGKATSDTGSIYATFS